jgi:NAD(P)-dependent dehydrogenase (short-subunit alcohol dehydrogenase family)
MGIQRDDAGATTSAGKPVLQYGEADGGVGGEIEAAEGTIARQRAAPDRLGLSSSGFRPKLRPSERWGEKMRLKDKVAIITGGAHGMGECEARLFAKEGAKVVIADVLEREGEAVAADISAGQAQARFVRTDVTVEGDWERVIEAAVGAYGRLDILVNNAGISGSSVGDHDGLEGWNRVIAVNATSVFIGTKRAAAAMARTGGGAIVNISSIMGIVGSADGHPAYAASKAAVRNYTKAAACRYGPVGVRVNSVHPGYLPPMLNATNAGGRQAKVAATPLRRLGEVIDVAYGVLYLASDEASFVTGAELVIDGGFIAQ